MTRILLVKTSSLGDIVHNLPVATDILARIPGAEITWVVEDAFAAVPKMHPAVKRVIPVAIRRWRKAWWRADVRRAIGAARAALRESSYDAIIDTQGLFKSAVIARTAQGVRYGPDFASSREPLAVFYNRTFTVSWALHAVERNRSLAAQALGYDLTQPPLYGIRAPMAQLPWLPREPYAVLLHATSAERKLWPEARWIALGLRLAGEGVRCILPWGRVEERERSERLAGSIPNALVAPAMSLADLATLMAGAQVVVGVDTGLAHLATALGMSTVGIYCATDPAATGLYGSARALNVGAIGSSPTPDEVLRAIATVRQ